MATQRKGLTQEGESTSVGAGFILPGKKRGMPKEKNKEGRGGRRKKEEVLIVPELLTFPKVSVHREAHLRFLPFRFWRLCFVFCLFFSRFCCASVRCRISAGAGFLSLLQHTSQSLPLQFSLGLSPTLLLLLLLLLLFLIGLRQLSALVRSLTFAFVSSIFLKRFFGFCTFWFSVSLLQLHSSLRAF
jgi:hypothetical protein